MSRATTVAFLIAIVFSLCLITPATVAQSAQQPPSAEQQLADMYAPDLVIKHQPSECDSTGEPYLPVSVEAVLGDPEVRLMRQAQAGESGDVVVMNAPTAQDLYGKDDTYYLDLPGRSRRPGCDYEEWSRARIAELGLEPSIYARIATEPDRPGLLALQYWFYWVFDDFLNTHESDWEMIQLTFEADTAEEALGQEPVQVSFAQHEGGEQAEWDDDKLDRDGTHVTAYFAAGSHATYYQDALWIGWGEHGSGFGCDAIDPEVDRLAAPEVILLPGQVTRDSKLAWLNFGGRWGERQPWAFNGPLSPNAGLKWDTPISWTDDLREFSLAVPTHATIGPGPAQLFCSLSSAGGSMLAFFPLHPRLVIGVTAVVLAALAWFVVWSRHYIGRAIGLYFRHARLFLILSATLLVVASIATALADFANGVLGRYDSLGTGSTSNSLWALAPAFSFGTFQQLTLSILVAPLVMHLTVEHVAGDRARLRGEWRPVLGKWFTVLGALLLNALILTLLAATLVLIPVAIYKGVQWFFTGQAVIVDGCSARQARHHSRRQVRHNWWRTLGMSLIVSLVAGVPGPVVGMALFIAGLVSIEIGGLISGLVYAVAYPIAIIASTLLYLRLREAAIDEPEPAPSRHWWRRRRKTPRTMPGTVQPAS